jgi:hypothetical protein
MGFQTQIWTGANGAKAGAGGLGIGADGHRDHERTSVECDSGVVEPRSVTSLAASYVLRVMVVGWGVDGRGQKSEVTPAFLPSL